MEGVRLSFKSGSELHDLEGNGAVLALMCRGFRRASVSWLARSNPTSSRLKSSCSISVFSSGFSNFSCETLMKVYLTTSPSMEKNLEYLASSSLNLVSKSMISIMSLCDATHLLKFEVHNIWIYLDLQLRYTSFVRCFKYEAKFGDIKNDL